MKENANKEMYYVEGRFEMDRKEDDILSAIRDDVITLEGVSVRPLERGDEVYTYLNELPIHINKRCEVCYGVICNEYTTCDGEIQYDVVEWDYTLLPFDIYLTQDAYICGYDGSFLRDSDNNGNELPTGIWDYWYTATAADYTNKKYQVFWTILPDFDIHHSEDESEACDWDSPYMILDDEGRNVVDFVRGIRR